MLGQKSVAREGIGPGGEATAVILLNVQTFTVYTHKLLLLIRYTSFCRE